MPLQYNNLSTLTSQQQRIANSLEGRVGSAGSPTDFSPEATSRYIDKSVATPLLNTYDQDILPRLKDSFAAIGALAGNRRGVVAGRYLGNIQDTIAGELAKAQLQNQQLSAQQALQYNQLGAGLVGQEHMAIQPYTTGSIDQDSGGFGGGFGTYKPFGALTGGRGRGGQTQQQGLQDGIGSYEHQGFGDYLDSLLSGDAFGQEEDSTDLGGLGDYA